MLTQGRRSMVLMVAFVALWAVVEVLAMPLLRRYSPYQVVWTRYGAHLALMMAIWGWRDFGSLWRTRRPAYQLGRSMLMVGMPASWITATQLGIPSRTVNMIFWTAPLLVVVFARFVLGERAPPSIWIITLAACVGAVLTSGAGSLPATPVLALPLTMAATLALYVVMTRSLRTESTRANLFYTALGVFLVLSPFLSGFWVTPTPGDMLLMIAVGVVGYVALLALDRSAAAGPVSVMAPLMALQVPMMMGLFWGLGRFDVTGWTVLGLLLVGAAALYVWTRESAAEEREAVVATSDGEHRLGRAIGE